jgi:hypothetical protein
VIADVEPTAAIRSVEVDSMRLMIERTEARFGLKPQRLIDDTAYGTAEILGWTLAAS